MGLIFIAAQRAVEECNGYGWAKGPFCYIVAAALRLKQPVQISKKGQALLWKLSRASPEEREQMQAQMPDGSSIRHDLAPLEPEPEPLTCSGGGTA